MKIRPEQSQYMLATIHRKENTDSLKRLERIFAGIQKIANETQVILPVHPRLEAKLCESPEAATLLEKVTVVPAVSYLEMLFLQKHADVVLTDSGGVQKEAFFLGAPCFTLRNETEWPETASFGWNRLANADLDKTWSDTSSAVGSIGVSGLAMGTETRRRPQFFSYQWPHGPTISRQKIDELTRSSRRRLGRVCALSTRN